MNAQVFTTSTSASDGSEVSSCPACCAMPSITSPSTRFFGQPRERKPIFMSSGIHPVDHPWIRNGFAQMIDAANPRDDALDPHAETAVRDAAEAAEVEI